MFTGIVTAIGTIRQATQAGDLRPRSPVPMILPALLSAPQSPALAYA
jgi:hypothetical protein